MVYVIVAIVALAAGSFIGYMMYRRVLTGQYKDMVSKAEKEADVLKETKLLEVKEKFINKKMELEKEVNIRNQKIQQEENKLKQREISLNRKQDDLGKRHQEIEQMLKHVENEN